MNKWSGTDSVSMGFICFFLNVFFLLEFLCFHRFCIFCFCLLFHNVCLCLIQMLCFKHIEHLQVVRRVACLYHSRSVNLESGTRQKGSGLFFLILRRVCWLGGGCISVVFGSRIK